MICQSGICLARSRRGGKLYFYCVISDTVNPDGKVFLIKPLLWIRAYLVAEINLRLLDFPQDRLAPTRSHFTDFCQSCQSWHLEGAKGKFQFHSQGHSVPPFDALLTKPKPAIFSFWHRVNAAFLYVQKGFRFQKTMFAWSKDQILLRPQCFATSAFELADWGICFGRISTPFPVPFSSQNSKKNQHWHPFTCLPGCQHYGLPNS